MQVGRELVLGRIMLEKQTDWKKYEKYTKDILNDRNVRNFLGEYFNLHDIQFQTKREFRGDSGTQWEVDAYGYDQGELILIECKHYKNDDKIEQNIIAAFAYIIKDIGAKSGIFITTNGLQAGAKIVADSEGIKVVLVDKNSTDENFFARFPDHNHSMAKLTDTASLSIRAIQECTFTRYPLTEAFQKLRQDSQRKGINRTDFSNEEVLEEAKKMIEEE